MIYCKNELTSRQIHECCILSPDLECLCIELFCQGKRILFASWYRPPASNKDDFKLNISSVLDKMTKMNPNFMVIGADLNFPKSYRPFIWGFLFYFVNTFSIVYYLMDLFLMYFLCITIEHKLPKFLEFGSPNSRNIFKSCDSSQTVWYL